MLGEHPPDRVEGGVEGHGNGAAVVAACTSIVGIPEFVVRLRQEEKRFLVGCHRTLTALRRTLRKNMVSQDRHCSGRTA